MNADKIRIWVDALRSGQYRQTTGGLALGMDPDTRAYCCLGVACEVAIKDGLDLPVSYRIYPLFVEYGDYPSSGFLPTEVQEWLGLIGDCPEVTVDGETYSLVFLNDEQNWDFDQIADVIEKKYLKGKS